MTTYTFTGEITLGRGKHPFERDVEGESKKHAKEKLFSQLGSEHSIKKTKIKIETEEEA